MCCWCEAKPWQERNELSYVGIGKGIEHGHWDKV